MDQDMITDITLDHLPELSEASISFQIPSNNASADLLLADNTDGFDALCDGVDDDMSFAPVALSHPRGLPLTLGELTPRVQRIQGTPRPPPHGPHHLRSPTPTRLLSSSAKPSGAQLTLGHHSPDKQRKTPRPKSMHKQIESPLVSSERFQQLQAEVETLGQVDESPSHVRMRVIGFADDDCVECITPSHVNSNTKGAPEYLLEPIAEEKDGTQDGALPADEDVVMATGDSCPANAISIAVAEPPPKSKRNPRTSSKPTLASGGSSKRTAFPTHVSKKRTKGKPSRARETHPVPPSAARQPPPQSIDAEDELVPPACMSGDMDSKPESTQITHPGTGGLAERLVSYSQKLISSIGLYKTLSESSSTESSDNADRAGDTHVETGPPAAVISPLLPPPCIHDISSTHSEPFRLSEISPHKKSPQFPEPSSPANIGTLQDGRQHAMSPTRPVKKRSSMDADQPQECHQRKRRKRVPVDASAERGSSNAAVSQGQPRPAKKARVHEEHSATHPETRDNTQHLGSAKSTLPSARTKYRPKPTSFQCKGPTLPYSSSSRQVHERINRSRGKRDETQSKAGSIRSASSLRGSAASSHLRPEKRSRQETVIEDLDVRQRYGPTSTADLPLIEKKPNATLSVAQLTKPVGFTFRVDARLEARKAEERLTVSEPGRTHPLDTVPEAKAHRASQQAAFTFHREAVVPSAPVVPFFFCTEQRAKEREKFDEMVKRKEEVMQRLKEEQRRREAEEEEKTIKELRRKAIPKANEIPEWYADMPKRKGTVV